MRVICLSPPFMPSALCPFHPCDSSLGLCCPTRPVCGTTETQRWSGRPWLLGEMSPDRARLKNAGKVKDRDRAENHAYNRGAVPVKKNGWSICGWGVHGFPPFFPTFFSSWYLSGLNYVPNIQIPVLFSCAAPDSPLPVWVLLFCQQKTAASGILGWP